MYHAIGLKQTRGIKKRYSEDGKKFRVCRGLLRRVVFYSRQNIICGLQVYYQRQEVPIVPKQVIYESDKKHEIKTKEEKRK